MLLALIASDAFGCGCSMADLPTSVADTTETLVVEVLAQVGPGAPDQAWKVRILRVFEGCLADDRVAVLRSDADPADCGATLTVGDTWLVTADYETHVGALPVLRFDACHYHAPAAGVAPADRAWLLAHERGCRRPWWVPAPKTTWQWQLQGPIDTTPDVAAYDLDLFDVPQATVDALHADGRTVICYFSAGSAENWRPDIGGFAPTDLGEPLDGWPGERWLDTRSATVRAVMKGRLDGAVAKGCDAVEPDNVDAYTHDSGFPLTRADQMDYNRFLANEAHLRGLSVGLKNALGLVRDLHDQFDWALNESCLVYQECPALAPFLDHGKAVLHAEYVDTRAEGPMAEAVVCPHPDRAAFSTLIKTWDLDAWAIPCP